MLMRNNLREKITNDIFTTGVFIFHLLILFELMFEE